MAKRLPKPTTYLIATLMDLALAKTDERRKMGNAAFVMDTFDEVSFKIAGRLDRSCPKGRRYPIGQMVLDRDYLIVAAGLTLREAAKLPTN